MKKKGIFLAVLLLLLAGVMFYENSQPPPNTPRESLEARVAQAKKSNSLSSSQEAFLKVQLAIVSYQVKYHQPPNKLEDLVTEYFDAIPKNPETGQPFEYKREGSKYKLSGLTDGGPILLAKKGSAPCNPSDKNCLAGVGFENPNEIQDDPYRYDQTGKRDPFQPFDFSARPRNPGASSPLEQYDLGQLRLTAVLEDPNRGSTGIIEDQAGKGFNVKIGTKIGLNSGVIVSIEKDRLKILESEKDITGKESQRIVEMKIQAEPGGRSSGKIPAVQPKRQMGR